MHAAVLTYLDQIDRRGSIRGAAATLAIASSAVNRRLLRLERELGTPLFQRRRDGVTLTPAGQAVLAHARGTLDGFARLGAELDALRGVTAGVVKIVAIDSLMVNFLPSLVADLARAHPRIVFQVLAEGPVGATEALRAGLADIALAFVDERNRDLAVVARCEVSLGVIMAPGHPLARLRQVRLAECASYPMVLSHDSMPLNPLLASELAEHGTRLGPRVVSNGIDFMRRMILAGLGVGLFTPLGFAKEIARGQLVHRPLAEPRLARLAIGAMTLRRRPLAPAAALALEAIRARLGDLAKTGATMLRGRGIGRRGARQRGRSKGNL
ncbi:MAG: LysR family transcriptional regulator [Alphaproteobacteria bacterium]|nr:LysR family transcriptional regulator [Alphaproteobacteria bacterium]